LLLNEDFAQWSKLHYTYCAVSSVFILFLFQPICQSLKIGNCFNLARLFSHAAVLGDHVCKVQCAFVFRALPKVVDPVDNQLGFS
jgi:hypothetical protein